jgi:hypothetical protein
MSAIPPVVRHMLLCDTYRVDPNDRLRVDLLGVRHTFQASGNPRFPFTAPPFLVLLRFTGARGKAKCRIDVRHAATQQDVHKGPEQMVTFTAHPLSVLDLRIPVSGCAFPAPGLYTVQFRFEDRLISQEPLRVR